MLTGIRIQGLRCFEDLQYQPLRRLNLIGGGNNAGKTTLLEGIYLLAGANNPALATKINIFRGIEKYVLEPNHVWGNLFHGVSVDKPIVIEGAKGVGSVKLAIEVEPPREITIDLQNKAPEVTAHGGLVFRCLSNGQSVTSRSEIRTEEGKAHISSPIVNTPIFPSVFLHTRWIKSEEDADRYSQLDKANSKKALAGILAALKIFEPRLTRLSVITEGPIKEIHGALEGIGTLLPLSVMGGGMVRLTSLLLAIYGSEGGIVPVDEIENGLHHSILPKVWQALSMATKEANVQLFATTHSYECIRAARVALQGEKADVGYCRLERVNGKIQAVMYEPDEMEAAVDQRAEVR